MSNDPTTNTYLGEIVAVLHEIRDRQHCELARAIKGGCGITAEEAMQRTGEAIRGSVESERPESCCGDCPPIAGGGYDCTCDERCERSTQDAPAGRIGWLRFSPEDHCRYLVREVGGGWAGDDSNEPDFSPHYDPDAVFTPIATLPEGYVAVRREDVADAAALLPSGLIGLRESLRAALDEGADDA